MITLEKITKTYHTLEGDINALSDINLQIKQGEYISIIGHSGSGKTTLLNIIGGILRPTKGNIFINNINIWELSERDISFFRNRQIGFIFQFSSLIPTLTAIENILLPASFYKISGNDIKNRAEGLLSMVNMQDKAHMYPKQLSGGQQRRVAIARALINSPEIILADEPTGDLDETTESWVMQIFKRLNEQQGTTIIMVTHNSGLAAQASKTLKMHNGKIEMA